VLAVAHALEVHKTISGQDVTAIIDGTQGPVVDGRPYVSADFAAEIEAYHLRAAGAHGGDRSAPLLVPVPRTPAGLGVLPSSAERFADPAAESQA
jgi:cell division protease FtsH